MTKKPTTKKITSKDKQEARETLASLSNNYVTAVTRKTDLSRATVSKFFNDQKISLENEMKIYYASLELILAKQKVTKQLEMMRVQIRQND